MCACCRLEKERNQAKDETEDVRSQTDHIAKLKASVWDWTSVVR